MKTTKDYLKVLNETINYYGSDVTRRGVNNNEDCVYYSKGTMCAVGRCLINPKDKDRLLHIEGFDTDVASLLNRFSEKIFKKEYRGFKLPFWEYLQDLHDGTQYWDDKTGLTSRGENRAEHIRSWIKHNVK